MSKNPHKKDKQAKGLLNAVNQQNQPIMKALHNKVRNINKKLTQIAELQIKDNLKPQQVQKINKKPKIIQQKAKFEEFLTFYREMISDNYKQYRQNQKRYLLRLGEALAIYNTGSGPNNKEVAAIYNAITTKSQNSNEQRIEHMNQLLGQFADNKGVKQWIQNNRTATQQKNQNKQQVKESKQEEKVEQNKPEQKQPEKVQVQSKIPEPVPEKVVSQIVEPPKVEEKVEAIQQAPITQKQEQPKNISAEQQRKQGQNKRHRPHRERDPNRPRRNYKEGQNHRNEGKRRYKPKNETQQGNRQEQNKNEESSSSQQEQPIQRTKFTHKEVQQLHDQGFIVIGKPKVKAIDPKQRQQYHDKKHGRKFHHHGQKQNH